jgi:hypothetical protein
LNVLGVVLPPIYSIALTTGNLAGEEISQNVWYRNNIRPLLQDATGQKRDPTYLNMEFTPPNQ